MPRKPVAPVMNTGALMRRPRRLGVALGDPLAVGHERRAHRVEAAVDVQHLAGDPRAGSQSRNSTAPATGPGSSVSQPSGAWRRQASARSEKPGIPRAASVPSGPADTRFTRTPRGPRSRAR